MLLIKLTVHNINKLSYRKFINIKPSDEFFTLVVWVGMMIPGNICFSCHVSTDRSNKEN
jgi:hypothetical protein